MSKTLVLIRHGHRDVTLRDRDNGLSEKGQRQAEWLKKFFCQRFDRETQGKALLLASPKVRCVQTLAPIAEHLGRAVIVREDLVEDSPGSEPMDLRVRKFILDWSRSETALTVACSHGDWLPIAVHNLIGLHVDPRKGSWIEVEGFGNLASLAWSVPNFKPFYG